MTEQKNAKKGPSGLSKAWDGTKAAVKATSNMVNETINKSGDAIGATAVVTGAVLTGIGLVRVVGSGFQSGYGEIIAGAALGCAGMGARMAYNLNHLGGNTHKVVKELVLEIQDELGGGKDAQELVLDVLNKQITSFGNRVYQTEEGLIGVPNESKSVIRYNETEKWTAISEDASLDDMQKAEALLALIKDWDSQAYMNIVNNRNVLQQCLG